ncbi:hypothetical protein D3C84_1091420 [compost metagenome]
MHPRAFKSRTNFVKVDVHSVIVFLHIKAQDRYVAPLVHEQLLGLANTGVAPPRVLLVILGEQCKRVVLLVLKVTRQS